MKIENVEDLKKYAIRAIQCCGIKVNDDTVKIDYELIESGELILFDGIAIQKYDEKWIAMGFEHIPGQFNPRNGGDPPEIREWDICVEDSPTECVKKAIVSYLENQIGISFQDTQMEILQKQSEEN